jgi:Ni/Fe-hydrogenase subunit HybB-like protein
MAATPAALAREELERVDAPLVVGRHTDETLSDSTLQFQLKGPGRGWTMLFLLGLSGTALLVTCISWTIYKGIGVWGNNIPVGWAFDITNFVWWIGIGHAGTLISAILLVFQQRWRNSINRFAEAMTLFAVMCAAIFPVLHTGRPWFAFWMFPYPSTLQLWPQFKSPLMWDVFAISTYGTVSLLFWYLGLLPDLATMRDIATTRVKRVVYGIFALGWRGSARHLHDYKMAYLLLGGLSTPLVLSVHTIVSFDFAVSVLPGWHATIFPPYFVAGAVFSGFAMVVTLIVPARKFMGLTHVITEKHLENMNKVILATGMMVSYGYLMEHFIAYYSADEFERFVFWDRRAGFYRYVYFAQMFCNVLVPQIFWFKKFRTSVAVMWVASILIQIGMWTERFMIVVQSLHKDFLTSSWGYYAPTWVDWGLLIGTMSLFGTAFLLFLRFVPAVALSEVKEINHELRHGDHAGAGR